MWCRSRRSATLADATRAKIYTLRDMLHLDREVMIMSRIVQHVAELKKSTRLRDLKIEAVSVRSSDNCGQDDGQAPLP